MTLPTSYKVECAFNAGANTPDAQRIWTDVTQWVLFEPGIDIRYGRGDWRSTADPNTLRLTFNNSDGRFTAETERTNVEVNPSLETDTADWVQHSGGVTSVTYARQTGWAYEGSYSMRQTGTSGTTTLGNGLKGYIGSIVANGSFAYPVAAGQTWTARAQANVLTVPNGAGDPGLWAEIFYFDAALALLVQNNGPSIFQRVPLGVQTLTCTATAPATAAWMQTAFVMGTAQSSSVMDWYCDSVRVERAAAPLSPYYPNVKIGRPIRVTATLGSSVTRYVGHIDEWPLDWPATVPTIAHATVSASSRSAWMGQGVELRSIIEEEILLDEPVAYYTLGEPAGATFANDSSGNNAARLTQAGGGTAVVFGTATGPGTDGLTAATFAGGKYLQAPLTAAGTDRTVACAFLTSTTTNPSTVFLAGFVSIGNTHALGLDTSGNIVGPDVATTGHDYRDGGTHVAILVNSSAGSWLYVDGVLADTGANAGTHTFDMALVGGSPYGIEIGGSMLPSTVLTGTTAHAAFCTSALSAAASNGIGDACLTGFAGETPADRLTRYAAFAGVAATELNLETGQCPDLAHIDTTGKAPLDVMRTVEATEEGILFDGQDGRLTFQDRSHRYTQDSAFTLDVAQRHVSIGVQPRLDRGAMRNDVTATLSDGTASARAVNQPSINDYGPARESLDLATTNDDEPFHHASWLVNQYGIPRPRVPSLGVNLVRLPTALAQAVLAAGIGTRFTVINMPPQAEKSTQDYFIEGYTESIGPGRHEITFNVSQAEPFNVWIVGDPVYGFFDRYPIAF